MGCLATEKPAGAREPETILPPPWGAHRPGMLARAVLWASRHSPLGRGGARRALYRLFEGLHPGPVDTHLDGVPVRLHPARNVSERKALMRPDRHDAPERAMLREIVRAPGAVFLDIGANAGLYSLDAAIHAGEGARIVAIEPNAPLIARLRFNEALARAAGRVRASARLETCAVAISDHDGEAHFGGGDEGSGGLSAREGGRRVPIRALLGLAAELGVAKIDILKIDVEGHEDRALAPFLSAAPDSLLPRAMIVEHLSRNEWTLDCLAACAGRGYTVRFTTRNNTVLERANFAPRVPAS